MFKYYLLSILTVGIMTGIALFYFTYPELLGWIIVFIVLLGGIHGLALCFKALHENMINDDDITKGY